MAGAGAAILHPLARILTGACGIDAVTLHGQEQEPRRCCRLREEVAALRRGVELVYRQGQQAVPDMPDYSPTLGAMAKTLTAVGSRLEAMEAHPALRLTPDLHAREIAAGVRAARNEASDSAAAATRAGRPIRVKVHGKKREHGRHSYDFGREAVIPFRYRCGLPVYCVQSRRARRNARMFGY
jgi:hypothetical protein